MILKDKVTVAIRQDDPERNKCKTIYIIRHLYYDGVTEWVRWRGYKWAVHKMHQSESYRIAYRLD